MDKNWMLLLQYQNQLAKVMETNQTAQKYGLALSERDAELILESHGNVLREQRRIEFGEGIVSKIIYEFCDSDFMNSHNYVETIIRLQEIFYLYKNETMDELNDDELLHFMREQFEEVCFGDLEYLEGTCLNIFSQAVRAGYTGYKAAQGRGIYSEFDEVQRWDRELYLEVLKELC